MRRGLKLAIKYDLHPRHMKIILSLIDGPKGLRKIADTYDMPAKNLAIPLNQLRIKGLVEMVKQEKEGAKHYKIYKLTLESTRGTRT